MVKAKRFFYDPSVHFRFPDARERAIKNFNELAREGLAELLESKHLYQKASIDPTEMIADARAQILLSEDAALFDQWRTTLSRERLAPVMRAGLRAVRRGEEPEIILCLLLRNLKLYCPKCERREAFIPAWAVDFANEFWKFNDSGFDFPSTLGFQLLLLVYQCQSCRGEPESFLVRRTGWELQLHGRSPIEGLEVPKFIPKPEYHLFRDALIAFNSGKILAALFYLRSFIEQFARRVTNKLGKATGDEIMDAYYETLPQEHSSSMPSLREWYDKLSVPLHEARDDAQVFEEARKKIEKHFEIRKVFDIAEA